jgi:hypothetical protein
MLARQQRTPACHTMKVPSDPRADKTLPKSRTACARESIGG